MSTPEKHSFQAEIQQLLEIVIHSLYTDKEIFVRELVSNASDAMEKLRFIQASGEKVRDEALPLKISLTTDDQAHTLTFADTGLGMTKDELIQNLGTIARSGSKAFLQQLTQQKEKSPQLIGQFGVGFYAAFMAAEKVVVYTRSWKTEEPGWIWTSTGTGSFEIEPAEGLERGTKIVAHLKKEDEEFAKEYRIESILKRYSAFVSFPLELNGKAVNTVQAIWTRSKSDIKEEEYQEFYQFISHESEPPQYRLHFSADAPLNINSLLFVPKSNIEKLGFTRLESNVHLYCKKILIQSDAKGLFPEWLRFLKGVVDSEDLPLNISRETMQDSALMQKLNKVLTGRIIKMLDEESKSNPEQYEVFYKEFGSCLKEGTANDYSHREALSKLLRFESSLTDKEKTIGFSDYVARMPESQKEIYYLSTHNRESAEASPYYEVFKAKNIEVLFLFDPRDEFVMEHLRQFDGKNIKSAEKSDLSLDSQNQGLTDTEAQSLTDWMKGFLSDEIESIQSSRRLVNSPAVVVDEDPHTSTSMRRMMKAMQRDQGTPLPEKYRLEINPSHPLIQKLFQQKEVQPEIAQKVARQLLDTAKITAGIAEDPRTLIQRMHELMEVALSK
ncbi:MAG: molecular chaperone HtpG [Verrucomicrobiota bacterium]